MIGDRWGVTDSETRRAYPCDSLVSSPTVEAWRGVSDHDTTRMLLKVVSQAPRWAAPALAVGDLIMARRQLLNFKQLAEHHYLQASPAD